VSDWSNFEVILSVPVKLCERATLTGFVRYNEGIETKLGDFIQDGVTGGVTLGVRF
jgi:hypothetical protein